MSSHDVSSPTAGTQPDPRPLLDRLLTEREVRAHVPRGRTTLWRDVRAGVFPAPVRVGRRVYWRESDLRTFLAAQ